MAEGSLVKLFSGEFHCTDNRSKLVQVMACYHQATSHWQLAITWGNVDPHLSQIVKTLRSMLIRHQSNTFASYECQSMLIRGSLLSGLLPYSVTRTQWVNQLMVFYHTPSLYNLDNCIIDISGCHHQKYACFCYHGANLLLYLVDYW